MAVMKKKGIEKRIAWFLVAFLLAIFVLVGRIGWIQFVQGKRMVADFENQLKDGIVLQSPRGTIYDRDGRELAVSSLTKSLYANPSEIKDADTTASLLAPVLGMTVESVKERLTTGGQFMWIKRMLEPEVSKKVEAIIKDNHLPGLGFLEESKRYYPNGTLAAHVLGFVGTDDVGLDGVEMSMDKVIKGKSSRQWLETDNHGVPIFKSTLSFAPPEQGKNIYLTIDSTIQFIVEQTLDKAMAQTHAQRAIAIVMNPKTGEILAMADRPTYDPNQFYKYNEDDWKNRAVSYMYEPGSTFKTIVTAAALQDGKVRLNEHFTDDGYVEVSGRRIYNWTGATGPEDNTFVKIFEQSLNTGFVQVGLRVGGEELTKYAKKFGFGKPTGIDLPGEASGILFNPKDMRASDVATMSIGQSIAVTPIQLITAVSAIANDGVLLKPHIIKEIRSDDGTVDSVISPQTVAQVITPETAHTLTYLMEREVAEGGGQKAQVPGYLLAGKTGTAQKLKPGGGYYANQYIASFICFGPVGGAQQVAILVVLDDPHGMYYGAQVAAPIAGDIFKQVMRYLNIPPNMPQKFPEVPTEANKPAAILNQEATVPVPKGKVLVPDLQGKSLREAGEILAKAGLAMVPSGSGISVKQSVPANTIVDAGTEITVYFEER
jgi:stage V sporulation protein D (sporulation-specific penicillin-binding protein)